MPGTAVLPQSPPPQANMAAPLSPQTNGDGAGDESASAPWQQLVADAEEQAEEEMERAGAMIKWSDEVSYEEDLSVAAAADDGQHADEGGASELVWTEEEGEREESLNADGDEDAEGHNDNERAHSDEHLDAPLTTADLQATPAAPATRGAAGRSESPQPPRSEVNDALAREYSSATAALAARTAALAAQLAASQRALQEIEHRNALDQSWPQRADSASPGRPPASATMTPLNTRSASSASPASSALSIAALPATALAAHSTAASSPLLSSPLYSPHTQPRTAHVFLPPPPGVQPSNSPHAAALPSGLQLAAAAAKAMAATMSTPAIAVAAASPTASVLHSPHPYGSPLSASSGMSSSSAAAAVAWPSSFDPTAYAAASAHVYGDWRPAASPSPSPLPSAPVHPASDMRFFRATHLARAGGIPTHSSSGSDGVSQAAAASAAAGGLNVHDSFQRHLGLTLARHRAEDHARSEQPHSQATRCLPDVEVENTLQAQLRSLAASPELRSRGHARPSPSPSPSPVRLASSFSGAASAAATAASPRFSMSQLHASPAHARAPSSSPLQSPSSTKSLSLSLPLAPPPLSSPFPSPSPSPHYTTSVVGGTLQNTLSTLSSNLSAFQSAMLSKQQQGERARAAALDRLEEGAAAFDQALQLEVRNCKLASSSMQKSVESGIDRWDAAHFDPWCAQLSELETSVTACAARLAEMERAQSEGASALPQQLSHLDTEVSTALAEQRAFFEERIRAPGAAFEQALLLKVDRVAYQLQNLYARSHQQMNERHQQLMEGVQGLKQLRLQLGSSLEGWIVGEIGSVRVSLRDATNSRVDSDEQLLLAFQYATNKLQRGLQLLRQ